MKYCLSSKAEHEIAIIRNRKPRGECREASVVIRTDRTVKQGSGKRLQGENVHVCMVRDMRNDRIFAEEFFLVCSAQIGCVIWGSLV